MNAGGKKAVLWGTALDNLVSWRMVTPDAAWLEVTRIDHNLGKIHDAEIATFELIWYRADGMTVETEAADAGDSRRALSQGGLGKDVTDKFLVGAARRAEGRLRRHHHLGALHPAPHAAGDPHRVCLEFFGQVRDSTPAIVEIKRYLDARPGGAMLAGLEHLDERYVKAVGYATKAKRHGRPKMVLIGDIVGEDDDAVAKAASEVVRIANARGAEGFVAVSADVAQEVLARPRAHRGDRAAHQRVQDQRGRRHPARAARRLHRRHRAHQHRAVDREQARAVRRAASFLAGPALAQAWSASDDVRPGKDTIDAKVDEALALVSAVRVRWQDLRDRIEATFPSLQDHSVVVSWKTELKAPLSEILAGHAFAPVLARCNAIHKEVLRSRVFVALHMHAGDGNVHTNIPVNSDDYAMLREANAAVARIMRLARALGGVISGEHGIGITKLEYLTADELAPFARYKQKVDPEGRFNAGKLLRGRRPRRTRIRRASACSAPRA